MSAARITGTTSYPCSTVVPLLLQADVLIEMYVLLLQPAGHISRSKHRNHQNDYHYSYQKFFPFV